MCRLLAIRSSEPIDVTYHLDQFQTICKNSREYQGHGWGCAWIAAERWWLYRTIRPIWEDDFRPPAPIRVLLAHARSAFRDEGIAEENNMPFVDGERAFIFNGELHGVRIRADGRIGAEKIFNFIRRFDDGEALPAVRKASSIVRRRTAYVRAMNFVLADRERFVVHSHFRESPDYFTLHVSRSRGELVVCSAPYPGAREGWMGVANDAVETFL